MNIPSPQTEVVKEVGRFVHGEVRPVEVVVGFQRVYFGANHNRLRHIMEGFYVVDVNERATLNCLTVYQQQPAL